MKKVLVITIALLLAAAVAVPMAVSSIAAPRTEVGYFEQTLFGDPSAANGLEIDLHETYKQRIFWDSTLRFDSGILSSDTSMESYTKGNNPRMYTATVPELSIYTVIGGNLDAASGLGRAYDDMLRDALPDVEHSMRVRVADYYDYYPVSIYIAPEAGDGRTVRGTPYVVDEDSLSLVKPADRRAAWIEMAKIIDYFRIPVLDDQYVVISGTKNKDGKIYRAGNYGDPDESGDNYYLQSISIAADDGFYFYFYAYSEKNRLMDFSHVPGGYGLYFLPFSEEADGSRGIDGDGLRTVLPLDPDKYIYNLSIDADGHLLLVTREDGALYASVIETENYTQTQKVRLADCIDDSENYLIDICSGGDYLYTCVMENIRTDGPAAPQDSRFRFVLLAENGGEYEKAIDYVLNASDLPEGIDRDSGFLPWNQWGNSKELAWNGQKLAIASESRLDKPLADTGYDWVYDIRNFSYDRGCGIELAVLGKDGLEYLGVCSSTLDQANLYAVPKNSGIKDQNFRFYNYNVRPIGNDPVGIRWR